MNTPRYILWIEDEGAYSLSHYAAPVVIRSEYDFTLATTISDAIHFLLKQVYDVIIVDLRNLPGKDEEWIKLYQKLLQERGPVQLGLHLLRDLFGKPYDNCTSRIPRTAILEQNANIERYCILSVDPFQGEVQQVLSDIGFHEEYYYQKRVEMPKSILLDIIEKKLNNKYPPIQK